MSEKQAPRPGQATFAGWLIIGGSVILVATAWQRISTLHTLEFQDQLRKVLDEQPFAGSGLDVDTLQTTIRVLCMIAAAAATASAILGFQALQRSTSARLALTLISPLVVVGGFATAGFFAPMVAAGIVMLWLQPSRDWFAGRVWVPRATTPGRGSGSASSGTRPDPFAPPPPQHLLPQAPPPEPAAPEPTAPEPSADGPAPYQRPFGAPLPDVDPGPTGWPPAAPAVRAAAQPRAKRPGALVAACIITWASAAVVSGGMLVLSFVMAVARDELFDEIEKQQPGFDMQGMTQGELATATFVMTAVVVVWSLAAAVLAVLAFRGATWARVALVICTAGTGLVVLAAALLSPALFVLLGAITVTLWLLLRPDVTAWYRR
ncbi:hypothetical protein [Nocardioides sp. MH1]|uniref:hypothetical protein n=1 Tax=Nocardioides sp. MH1 TaxID=3242490 RepID=UPI0035217F0A